MIKKKTYTKLNSRNVPLFSYNSSRVLAQQNMTTAVITKHFGRKLGTFDGIVNTRTYTETATRINTYIE